MHLHPIQRSAEIAQRCEIFLKEIKYSFINLFSTFYSIDAVRKIKCMRKLWKCWSDGVHVEDVTWTMLVLWNAHSKPYIMFTKLFFNIFSQSLFDIEIFKNIFVLVTWFYVVISIELFYLDWTLVSNHPYQLDYNWHILKMVNLNWYEKHFFLSKVVNYKLHF